MVLATFQMEKPRRAVNQIAYTRDRTKFSTLQRTFIPLLSFLSSLYALSLSLRRCCYYFRLFSKHRLSVPVISVGNLTWGGNGKTPMVEYIARLLADSGISPLILTRGYAGGDEAKMLSRRLLKTPAKIGIGANRAAVAASFFKQYGYIDPKGYLSKETWVDQEVGSELNSRKISAVVLDDGMQHWSLQRDLEIVMVNGLSLWGNCQLIPLGPLREPLSALIRADVAVVHHANLVSEQYLQDIKIKLREVKDSLPIFFTRMCPLYFFEVGDINLRIPLDVIHDAIVLCVSAIGSADAFVQGIEKMGAFYVDRIDFSDHHFFQTRDIEVFMEKLRELENKFGSKPVIVTTEKDYDRDPDILRHLSPFKVMILCSELQIIPREGSTADGFRKLLKELLKIKWLGVKNHNQDKVL